MYRNMNDWTEIRRRVLVEGVSRRQILRETGMHRQTLKKILEHSEPPGYRQRHRDSPRTHPRIPFHLALSGVRRIRRERKRQPLGRNGTRRQKHR